MKWEDRGPERLDNIERDFKVCDFCGALNPVTNGDCFVCGWSGWFHTDRETVKGAIWDLEDQFGGLSESLFIEEIVPSMPPKPGIWAGLWRSVKKVFNRA